MLFRSIEVDGIRYGAIEAKLDHEQGSNVWLTFAMREGKNREIRNVLGALGLQVNRLIRVSFGPFQLGELPPGAVMEIRTRALREQIGERLAAIAGANFSGPLVEREVVAERAISPRPPRSGGEGQRDRRSEEKRGGGLARPQRPPPPTGAPRRVDATGSVPAHRSLLARRDGRPPRHAHKRKRPR